VDRAERPANCRDGVNPGDGRAVVHGHPRPRDRNSERLSRNENTMKKILLASAILLSTAAFAQTTTAVKDTGKAAAEGTKEAKENVEAAATKEPKKSEHKAKAHAHKASAAADRSDAKTAAHNIGKSASAPK
jgi:hypothetical protein